MSSPAEVMRLAINPMLCRTFDPKKYTIPLKGFVLEPKLDGLRCIMVVEPNGKVTAYSRNGQPFWNIEHILTDVATIGAPGVIYDGELFAEDWELSMGVVKSSQTKHPRAQEIKFHVWDCLTYEEWVGGVSHRTWDQRFGHLLFLLDSSPTLPGIQLVTGRFCQSLEAAAEIYSEYLDLGYEGGVLKDPEGFYVLGKRSKDWLKWKPWTDADLKIVDVIQGNEGKFSETMGKLRVQGEVEWNGDFYDVDSEVGSFMITDEVRNKLWKKRSSLVGKTAEIRFFGVTKNNALRFPKFVKLREDK